MRTRGVAASIHLQIDPAASVPLHQQIYDGLRSRILGGVLAPGLRLPSSRQLAAEWHMARTTVLQALDALAAEGFITARAGSSTRVEDTLPTGPNLHRPQTVPSVAQPLRLSSAGRKLFAGASGAPRLGPAPRAFRPGLPAVDLFPTALWGRIAARCCTRASTQLLDGGDPSGLPELRSAIAEHLSTARGVRCGAEQVFITTGTQSAYAEIFRLTIDPGDKVWVENPGYLGAHAAVIAAGGQPVPVRVDAQGLDVAAGLACAHDARLALVTPSHHYPLGVTMSTARRLTLLGWAARTGAVIVEDDYDSEFRYRGRPLTALQGLDEAGRVVYVGTFSKTLFPGLRLGFLVAPPGLVEAMACARATAPAPASVLEQTALFIFMTEGHFATHLRRMRGAYQERSEALLSALETDCGGLLAPTAGGTGMQLSATLPPAFADSRVRDEAARLGIEIAALSSYYLRSPRRNGLVFGFGGVRPSEVRAGTRLLARAIEAAGNLANTKPCR